MGFGVLLIGQTVPQNFFKKLFNPEKVSVAKDSVANKNTTRKPVIKKAVVVEEKALAPGIACPTPSTQTICLTSGTTYTQTTNAWNAIVTPDPTCTDASPITSTYTSAGSVNPATGNTLNGVIFLKPLVNYSLSCFQ